MITSWSSEAPFRVSVATVFGENRYWNFPNPLYLLDRPFSLNPVEYRRAPATKSRSAFTLRLWLPSTPER